MLHMVPVCAENVHTRQKIHTRTHTTREIARSTVRRGEERRGGGVRRLRVRREEEDVKGKRGIGKTQKKPVKEELTERRKTRWMR